MKILRKMTDSRGLGGDPKGDLAEIEPRIDLSMGRKIIENL